MKLSEGLEKLLNVVEGGDIIKGLCLINCELVYNGILNWEENIEVYKYLFDNRPFTWYSFWYLSTYWWEPGKVEPRKKWLKKHIKKLKSKGL